jgi:hypothetical protein
MKETGILFTTPMVRALLDGTKTQTRRVVKPQPYIDAQGNFCWNGSNFGQDSRGPHIQALASPLPSSKTGRVRCPYGQPGDRLWVREAHYLTDDGDTEYAVYAADDLATYQHLRSIDALPSDFPADVKAQHRRLRPSIHMPRWASRITLEITSVRVERLQDISEADARAEGAPPSHPSIDQISREYGYPDFPRSWYAQLWDSLNAANRPKLPSNPASKRYARVKEWLEKHPDTTSWAANPWVWVVEFRRLP